MAWNNDSDSSEVSDAETEAKEDLDDLNKNHLKPRPYQVELLEKALQKNVIVCLGTGTGKTFISVMLIKELAHQIRESFENGGKRTFFLVNTVPLVFQQAKVIDDETDLKVGKYVGDMGVDFWDKSQWQKQFKENQVFVMTAQIFLDILLHGFLGLSKTNLLVFDECHHAKKDHPFKRIMHFFDLCLPEDYPKVLGLTASIVNGKVSPNKIEPEIKQLEATLRGTCETASDAEEIEKFGAKPFEKIVVYDRQSIIVEEDKSLSNILNSSLSQALEFLEDCRVPDDRLKQIYKGAKSVLRECLDTLNEIGPWSANQVAGYLVRDLERAELFQVHDEGRILMAFCATQLRQFRKLYENFTENNDIAVRLYLRPKVRKLLETLKPYKDMKDASLCGIVFVEKRYAALSLSQLINEVASGDAELGFISCHHVTGHGNAGGVGNDAEMSFKKQEKVLRKFREHEFNLLIATSVVEEGLDVPKCNYVARFDFPLTYRSYVQSKGRARAKESRFIILAEKEREEEITCQVELYKAIEEYLFKASHGRESPTEEESNEAIDTDYLPPFMPVKKEGKARLTMSNSIALLCRYCSKLPGDIFTHLTPEFQVSEAGNNAYICAVFMPTISPLRRAIQGDPMPRKKLAKMAAAYRACIELYKMKELDDDLLPVRSLTDEESEQEDEKEDSEGTKKTGTKKRRRLYDRKIPSALKGSLPIRDNQVFLYTMNISEREISPTVFGLITNKKIPKARPFDLFPDDGPVTVTIEEQTRFVSDEIDLQLIRQFHCNLFSLLLRRPLSYSHSDDGYYVVLIKGRHTIDFEKMTALTSSLKEWRARGNSSFTAGELLVPLHYKKKTDSFGSRAYKVIKVCYDMSPLSSFPDKRKAATFKEYYQNTYNETVTDMEQPLLQVQHMSYRVNFLTDRHKITKKEKKEQKREIHFIPELCKSLQFPADVLSGALMLPSVLYRFNSLLLVEEFKETVVSAINEENHEERAVKRRKVNQSTLKRTFHTDSVPTLSSRFNLDSDDYSTKLKQLFSNRDPSNIDINLDLLYQALTTTNAGDAFDLERLEMLGDAFLKQAVSIYLFGKYKDKDEGRLTNRKVNQISNRALFKMAQPKGLPSYMFCTQLDRDVWCPPNLWVSDSFRGNLASSPGEPPKDLVEQARMRCTKQEISDKSVADSVEALIGAYLTSCGYLGALKFMKYLGLQVLPEEEMVSLPESSRDGQYAALTIPELKYSESEHLLDIRRLTSGFETFEAQINYTFHGEKLYLLQALSHPSYQANRVTGCYQRLEFLGDAILDFLVTQHVYFYHGKLNPGQLTDIRQALVNNNIFATIAVRYGFHKYLKQMSPLLFKTIDNFVQMVHEHSEGKKEKEAKVTADSFIILADDNNEGIEAPKVLGDIFESVAGAIFLDSGMDLVKTWEVYYRMMKPYIDHYSKNVPINPIREVHEKDENAKFSKSEELPDGKIKCTLTVSWGEFVGKGSNGRIAKLAASKIAMQNYPKGSKH